MKNKLEDEYRQLMQNETPDLWSRIEAGIDAKIAAEVEEQEYVLTDFEVQASVKKNKRGAGFWKKYSLPMVACIAAVLCVPLLLTGFLRMASGGAKSETAAADMAAAEENTSVTMDCEDMPAEEYAYVGEAEEEAAAEEKWAAQTEGTPAQESDSALGDVTTDGVVESYDQDIIEDDTTADLAETESATEKQETETEMLQEEQAESLQILTVTAISTEEGILGDLEEAREKGTIYTLKTLEEGECTVFVPADLAFVIDLNYQLKILVEPGTEKYDFVFVGMAE